MRFLAFVLFFIILSTGCSDQKLKASFAKCMQFQKGVYIGELYGEFRNGEFLQEGTSKDENAIHFFSPHPDYYSTYESYIVARVAPNGNVLNLSCSEKSHAF